ncbi:MAG: amino acid adenylation domain-containing protein [Niabella sp.]
MDHNYELLLNGNEQIGFPEKTIVELFEAQVSATPNRTALVFKEVYLTYGELEVKVNRLANYLLHRNVTTEDLVGICIERSVDMVVGMLAIAKTGAAYVPMDPAAPKDRIGYMLEDACASIIISTSDLKDIVSGFENVTPVYLDLIEDELKNNSHLSPQMPIKPENLLYVIYTSGSTGKPKGALIEHRNVVRLFFNDAPLFEFKENDVWTMFHSFNFDFSVWEMYGALLFGGKLVVVDKQTAKDPSGFYELMKREGVTILNQTPSAFNALQDVVLQKEPLKKLRYVIFGGEALYPAILKKWHEVYTWCDLINMYGITETTVHVTYKKITEKEITSNLSDIGEPIPTLFCIILDEQLQPVPPGVVGELSVGGAGVSRGYLNRPELTAEKFIKNPYKEGSRLYRSGDLARRLPDGSLEYIGRRDNQVKIRGYRIELGEIESRLQEVEGVHQSVVIAKERGETAEKYLVAYFTKKENAQHFDIPTLREVLRNVLPEYMIPDFFIELDAIPLTSNGKVDKKTLPEPDETILRRGLYVAPVSETERRLADSWQKLLGFAKIGIEDNFFELGGNSLLAQKLVTALKKEYDFEIPITKLYQNPTIAALQKFLKGEKRTLRTPQKKRTIQTATDIAVIGMECNFPGAGTIEAFWDILVKGKETTRFFSAEELDKAIPDAIRNDPAYVKARGIIEDADLFDAAFFGISPKLAELMDPQHRLFLEVSRNLLEKTGYLSDKTTAVIGVFAGCSTNTYFNNNVVWHRDKIEMQGSIPVISVSDKDYVSSRVSYQLNLSGPAVNVNTACSTSLVAIAQAVESLRAGQCDTAIAGGAAITVPGNSGHLYEEGSMLSADGHCRPFDADARGTVFSDGVGAVLLKRLKDAIADGDTVYAVIKGVGINNDGGNKGSFTAPSIEGQAAAILMALNDAKADPAQISYIETHGTATPLGDPIEVEGLKLAFGKQEKSQFCSIGSVKSNFGHLTHAAGAAGFIKTVLSLYHKQLPPSINFAKPNPHIDFTSSPFIVNDQLKEWRSAQKRMAGVSSFGVGGTNAHVVLEEYEDNRNFAVEKPEDKKPQLVCWSAHQAESVVAYAGKLSNFLEANAEVDLPSIAYSINTTRQELAVRNFIVARDNKDLLSQLMQTEVISGASHHVKEKNNNIVFLFPGQGNQYPNMGRELYECEEIYKAAVDECAVILQQYMGEDIRDVIFVDHADEAAAEKLKDTRYAQPAIFITSYALAKLYISWGIKPVAFAGHSVGEFVGAHLSGIFSLDDVLRIVAERGRLISALPAGSMLSVRASEEKVKSLLPPELAIAAQNATELCVVSGETEVVNNFAAKLTEEGIINKPLKTSHAFHSAMMDPIVPLLKAVVETATMNVPQIPILSTVTAGWLKDGEAASASYWANHARATVQFGKALKAIQQDLNPLFLETGPGASSSIFVKQNGIGDNAFPTLTANTRLTSEVIAAKIALGKLWQHGAEMDWNKIYNGKSYRLLQNLPTYAYNKKRFWVNPPVQPVAMQSPAVYIPQTINETITNTSTSEMSRKDILLGKLAEIIESASGISVAEANPNSNFAELGLDSLLLTQLTTSLKKEFSVPVTFRQLSEDYDSLGKLAAFYDANLPESMFRNNGTQPAPPPALGSAVAVNTAPAYNHTVPQAGGDMLSLMSMQLQLLTQQMAMMQQGAFGTAATGGNSQQPVIQQNATVITADKNAGTNTASEELTAEEKIELKKPFGATARIEKKSAELSEAQQQYITRFIEAYNKKTAESKKYTQQHRARMADPRVVSGFKPYTKEMVYSIVAKKSKGCYLWDIDGNKYIDALNGFGSNFFGYQPDFIKEALLQQVEEGYEIGPQHVLAGEVSDLICELTGMDRAALCNTGSEAVLGAMRIARTVTGKDLIVAFTGSYHGIMDEVLVRGSKKLKTYPAASGILAGNVQNMLILEYGSEESLRIIKERASEIAAVLVEPVQSRRPEFQPVEFLKELRKLTAANDVALIFDEVITGFRSHVGGTQALFGIKADIATYGKVAGAGISIGIIAGSKKYMDALDGGYWEYGDNSIPEVGVTYFAGTFVRHPLALATTKAALTYLKSQGPGLQKEMNEKTDRLAARLNQITQKYRVPIYIVHFSSLWKIKFKEEYPYYELLFALMRLRNIHIWDLFPCFLTIAHTKEDIDAICTAFEESIAELCKAGFIPQAENVIAPQGSGSGIKIIDNSTPPVAGARLGKDKNGSPAWFVPDENNPGKYLQISLDDK